MCGNVCLTERERRTVIRAVFLFIPLAVAEALTEQLKLMEKRLDNAEAAETAAAAETVEEEEEDGVYE
jgi:hypothetical protein